VNETPIPTTPAGAPPRSSLPAAPLLAFLAAVAGRLPALGAWWHQDDWGLLARAAGLPAESSGPARFVSRVLYWDVLHPLFGLSPDPFTWSRLLLHGGSAALVVRIAGRCGLGAGSSLLAGLLFGAAPLAYTPLYWASGVQELLGVFFALAAVALFLERDAGRGRLAAALALGAAAILSKEAALGLGPLLALILLGGRRRGLAPWLVAAALTALAALEAVWVLDSFAHGPGRDYALGGARQVLVNLGLYGWWLTWPGPVFASRFTPAMGLAGYAVWLAWTLLAVRRWRRGDRRIASLLTAALLSLAPALALHGHHPPYLALAAAAAWVLTLASLAPATWRPRAAGTIALALTAAVFAWGSFEYRSSRRDEMGLPLDPTALRTAVSWQAARTLSGLPESDAGLIVLFQPPGVGPAQNDPLPAAGVLPQPTLLYTSLGGPLGPRMLAPDHAAVRWSRTLMDKPIDALVLTDVGPVLRFWGPVGQALVYLTLTEVGLGDFDRAAEHLEAAMRTGRQRMAFVYDPGQMVLPPEVIAARAPDFLAHLDQADAPPEVRAALRETAGEILAAAGLSGAERGAPDAD